jgi:hypothetical protein
MEQKITTRKPLNQNKVQENNEELIASKNRQISEEYIPKRYHAV